MCRSYAWVRSHPVSNGSIRPVSTHDGTAEGFLHVAENFYLFVRSVADLELACRVVFGKKSEAFDPAPIAYRDVKIPEKLRFGYYVNGTNLL